MPKELPSVEEAPIVLASALKALEKLGLSKAKIARLSIVQDYINYRHIEAKLLEMEKKYSEMATRFQKQKPGKNATKPTKLAKVK